MLAYRLCKTRYLPFDGTGALLHGARWNSPGRAVIYCADSFAGGLLEILVHSNLGRLPGLHHVAVADIPEALIEWLDAADLSGWDRPDEIASRAVGDEWLQSARSAVLSVPSLVAQPLGRNLLINPHHRDFGLLQPGVPIGVQWDARLFAR